MIFQPLCQKGTGADALALVSILIVVIVAVLIAVLIAVLVVILVFALVLVAVLILIHFYFPPKNCCAVCPLT